jgi:ubiquinone/menaquinone biosynthesis C-methylase UbiE
MSTSPPHHAPGTFDDFGTIDTWDEARAKTWADALDLRAAGTDQVRLREEILAVARLRSGNTVIEVGSGTGVLLPQLAAAVGASGKVIGLEPQPILARFACERIERERITDRCKIHVERGEASTLPDGIADVCIAQTVLCHLPIAARNATIAQMIRMTRRGGLVISADQDAETWVIDHPDRELTRRLHHFYVEQRFADGWTGRRTRGWLAQAGLATIESRAIVTFDTDPASYLYKIAISRADTAQKAGWITPAERTRWVGELENLAAAGRFFSSLNFYIAAGTVR